MRFALIVGLFIGYASACGNSPTPNSSTYASCLDWANANPDNLSPSEIAFCKDNTYPQTKTVGQCCTADSQCQSQRCCPYGAPSCGTGTGQVSSCECY